MSDWKWTGGNPNDADYLGELVLSDQATEALPNLRARTAFERALTFAVMSVAGAVCTERPALFFNERTGVKLIALTEATAQRYGINATPGVDYHEWDYPTFVVTPEELEAAGADLHALIGHTDDSEDAFDFLSSQDQL